MGAFVVDSAPLVEWMRPVSRWCKRHSWAVCGIIALGMVACGRPATEAECEQILERTARLELQERLGSADPKLVEAEVQSTKQALQKSMMEKCVGKRITDGALECVRNAKTSQELAEDCFR